MRTLQWPTASFFGNTTGCVDGPASMQRAQQYDTRVETTDGSVRASVFDFDANLPPFPPQFSDLWNNIVGAACGEGFCEGSTETTLQISNDTFLHGGRLVMTVNGRFANAGLRDNFFELGRQAFDRSVTSERGNDQLHEDGLEKMYITSDSQGALGGFLDIEFSVGETRSCPDVVDGIMALGSLVPHLGPIFGAAGAVCAFIG
ncbi:MAG: hypothetical protein [Circular genetic element sp.]|nr:MAG: hypothetical protein [Circular genetic element sp.]